MIAGILATPLVIIAVFIVDEFLIFEEALY